MITCSASNKDEVTIVVTGDDIDRVGGLISIGGLSVQHLESITDLIEDGGDRKALEASLTLLFGLTRGFPTDSSINTTWQWVCQFNVSFAQSALTAQGKE